MKVTKRQLRRIIAEEKTKILNEYDVPFSIQETIDGWLYRSEEELNGSLSAQDRDWHRNPEILDAIQIALDVMKDNVEVWRNQ